MRHLAEIIGDLVLEAGDGFLVIAKAKQDVAIGNPRRERAAQVLAQALVQGRQQNPARVEAVHRLEENQIHLAIFIGGGVGADRFAASDEIGDGNMVQIVERHVPAQENRLRNVGDRCRSRRRSASRR